MVLTSDEVSSSRSDEVYMPSSNNDIAMEMEVDHIETPLLTNTGDEERLYPTSTPIKLETESPSIVNSVSISSNEVTKQNLDNKRQNRLKARSVSFAPTVQEFEIPSSRHSSFSLSSQPIDFIDVLVESYKLEISTSLPSLNEVKKYLPRTIRTRTNPNWREHRIRRLMNKLEELSLWDREEELKATQAQFLREQKLEQIQDRQRNHDLCLQLMRQRHESEIESAVLLDQALRPINNENTSAKIARTIHLTTSKDDLSYDLPIPPARLRRHVQQQQDQTNLKTPVGRYRQFEAIMDNKLEKVNQKLKLGRQIIHTYNPYYTSIPPTVVPLFSETYIGLLSVPDICSTNKYGSYHNDVTSPLQLSSLQHSFSPDHEIRLGTHRKRDVRVPLKEQMNDNIKYHNENYNDNNNNNNNVRSSSNAANRSTDFVSSTASALYDLSTSVNNLREPLSIYNSEPMLKSVNQRSLTEDLNVIANFSIETKKKILQRANESPNATLIKTRPTLSTMNKRVKFIDADYNDTVCDENMN